MAGVHGRREKMMDLGTIKVTGKQDMVNIVAFLVREGLTFTVVERSNSWVITLTGGY